MRYCRVIVFWILLILALPSQAAAQTLWLDGFESRSGASAELFWNAPEGLDPGDRLVLTSSVDFGEAAELRRFDDFSGADAFAEGEDVTAGVAFDRPARFTLPRASRDARSGETSLSMFRQHINGSWRAAIGGFDLPNATEVFISFAAKVPEGASFPGNDGTPSSFSSDSSWKLSWLLGDDGNSGDDDIVVPTHAGGGYWIVDGNDTDRIFQLGSNPDWWKWGEWHRFSAWIRADPDLPATAPGQNHFQILNSIEPMRVWENDLPPFAGGTPPHRWQRWNVPGWMRTRDDRGNVVTLYDDLYLAAGPNAAARVEVGNASVYEDATRMAILEIDDWRRDRIIARIAHADVDFDADTWVFVTLADNTTRLSARLTGQVETRATVEALAQGAEATVISLQDPSLFGPKAQGPAALWDFGDEQFWNGQQEDYFATKADGFRIQRPRGDSETPWRKASYPSATNAVRWTRAPEQQRHDHVGANYFLAGSKRWLGWHRALGGTTPTTGPDRLYARWWIRTTAPFFGSNQVVGYRNLSGQFDTGPGDYAVGEPIRVDGTCDPAFGHIKRLGLQDGAPVVELTLRPANRVSSSCRAGAIVTGLDSGASLELEPASFEAVPSSIKILRIWDEISGQNGNLRLSWTNDLMATGGLTDYTDTSWYNIDQTWDLMEFEVEWVDRAKQHIRASGWINGKREVHIDGATAAEPNPDGSPTVALLGFNPNQQVTIQGWLSEIYMDRSLARVVLCNRPRYSECRQNEIQRILEWTPDQIRFALNLGRYTHEDGLFYLYVFDDAGRLVDFRGSRLSTAEQN